jgi:hypothetical protein
MRNNQVLFDGGSSSSQIDNICSYRAGITVEQTRFSQAAPVYELEADSEFYPESNINTLSLKDLSETLGSVFQGIGLAIKVSILVALSIVWAVIALPAVIIYLIIYKHFFEKIGNKIRLSRRKSPYYYKWKNHHLDLNWEA